MTEPETETFEDALASQRAELLPVHPYLFLVLECDRPLSGGARYGLTSVDEVVIGRGAQRAAVRQVIGGVRRLSISVPGRSMSSTHARLLRTSEGWHLEDARSTNGSFVNGERVERAVVRDGQAIELGHTLFVLREALATPPGTVDLDSSRGQSESRAFATLLPSSAGEMASLARIAESSLPVLLLGETGTGKEVTARSIHEASKRTGPFVAINCGALPANLVESQLFGHAKGAFSGATRDELGAIRSADEGTLLLDEIGDLPRAAQPALLRFLQEGEVTPVGSARPQKVDVRVVAATHQPLGDLAAKGDFRADLLARMSGFTHGLLPLRDRSEDLGIFVASILAKRGPAGVQPSLSPSAGRCLLTHHWPANIRETEHTLLRGLALAEAGHVKVEHLQMGASSERGSSGTVRAPSQAPPGKALSETDTKLRQEILILLEKHDGNVANVAKALGKARMQIHRWMQRFGIDAGQFRRS